MFINYAWETSPLTFKNVSDFVKCKEEIWKHLYEKTKQLVTVTEKTTANDLIILKGTVDITNSDLVSLLSKYVDHEFKILYVKNGDELDAGILHRRLVAKTSHISYDYSISLQEIMNHTGE